MTKFLKTIGNLDYKQLLMIGVTLLLVCCLFTACNSSSNTRGKRMIEQTEAITSNKTGVFDGYGYEFWTDAGFGEMILGAGGTFSGTWDSSNNRNVLLRRGIKFPTPLVAHTNHGNISVTYTASYTPSNAVGVSYFCIYGWTRNPLVEYYIVDNWGGNAFSDTNRPPGRWEENRTRKGEFEIDGAIYDVWTSIRTGKPSIDGNSTNFTQYWSVRRTRRTSGTINVTAHFNKWQELGMPMTGGLYEVALTAEGFNNTGSVNVTQNEITITK
jgi:endo-1,4-beta-xylanase